MPSSRRFPRRPGAATVVVAVGCAVYLAVAFGPLAALVGEAARAFGLQGPRAFTFSVAVPQRAALLARSAFLAFAVSAATLALGIVLATFLTRWRTGRAATLRWLLLVLAPVPAYVHALAWTSAAYDLNTLLSRAGLATIPLRGAVGAWWVEVMTFLPLAAGMSLIAIESVSAELVEAARLHRSEPCVLGRVTVPIAAPMLFAAGAVVFLLAILDYGVPALFQLNVYTLAVFADFSATNDVASAFAMALPLLVLAMVVVLAAQRGARQLSRRPRRRGVQGEASAVWPAWFVAVQGLAVAVLVAEIAVPLVILLAQVGAPRTFAESLGAARDEVGYSFAIALATSVACLPLALAAARPLVAAGRRRRAWWLAVTGPLAIPAPLVGIGLIALWSRVGFAPVYGTAAMPVLAALARFLPLAALAVVAQLRLVDRDLVDAARVHQVSARAGWLQVRLPMLAPGLLAAAGVAFALTLGELGATLLVAEPGRATLAMRIYNYLHYGASDAVAALCLLLAFAAAAAGALAAGALLAWSRLLPPSEP